MSLETTRLKQALADPTKVLNAMGLLKGARPQPQGYFIRCPKCGSDLSVRRVPHRGRQSPLMIACMRSKSCLRGDVFSLIEGHFSGGFRETLMFANRLARAIEKLSPQRSQV